MMPMSEALGKVIKRLHYPIEVMLVCVRCYVAYPLSLRHIEQMMAERGVSVDHATIHRPSQGRLDSLHRRKFVLSQCAAVRLEILGGWH